MKRDLLIMILVALTGSIGSGKSAVGIVLKHLGYEVFDADACVHELYQDEAVKPVGAYFPNSIIKGKVDRTALSKELAKDPKALKLLESIIHPLVKQKKREFLKAHLKAGTKVIFFDIPLLFETEQQNLFDHILVVTVSDEIRRARVLQRKNMTVEKLKWILQKQMPDKDKIKKADHVIYNNDSFEVLEQSIKTYLYDLNIMIENGQFEKNTALINWDLG